LAPALDLGLGGEPFGFRLGDQPGQFGALL